MFPGSRQRAAADFECWLFLFLNLVVEKPSNVRVPTIVRLASMKSQRFLFSTCTVTLLSVRQRNPHHEQQLREYGRASNGYNLRGNSKAGVRTERCKLCARF